MLDSTRVRGFKVAARGADSLGRITYQDSSAADLLVVHCSNVACTAATTATIDSVGFVGQRTSVTVGADGLPLVTYRSTSGALAVTHCANTCCTPYMRRR